MNLLFRLIHIYLFSRFRKPVPTMGVCKTPFRCWFTDLDVLMHMNNGKYFSLMDLARIDLMNRAGLAQKFLKLGWYPVVVAETAKFKKSIKLFDKFYIDSQVIGWDEKAILIKQTFTKDKVIFCEAVIRGIFLKKSGGSVKIQELLNEAKVEGQSPVVEPWIADWNKSIK